MTTPASPWTQRARERSRTASKPSRAAASGERLQPREAQRGDVVYVNVTGTPTDGEPFTSERMPIEIGAEKNIKQFNEKVKLLERVPVY